MTADKTAKDIPSNALPSVNTIMMCAQNTDYAKNNILRQLSLLTEGERRTLIRAVLVAQESSRLPVAAQEGEKA